MTASRIPSVRPAALSAALVVAAALAGAAGDDAAAAPALRVVAPGDDALVRGDALRVAVAVRPGATRFHARIDQGDRTRRFHRRGNRRGNRRVAKLHGVRPGLNHLTVRARVGGRTRYAHARFVVRGRRADLVRLLPATTGALRHAGAGTVPVAFSAARGTTVKVRLNGRRVWLGRPGARNVYRMVLNRGDGLRHGRNTLKVTAYRPSGRYEILTRAFSVTASTPLPAAGRDRTVATGRPIRLDAGRSLPSRRDSRLSYRWQVVQAPSGRQPILRGATTARPTFRPRRPGRYVVTAQVRERRRDGTVLSATDVFEAAALAPVLPLGARLTTMVSDPTGNASGDGVVIDSSYSGTSGGSAGGSVRFYSRTAKFPGGTGLLVFDPVTLALRSTLPLDAGDIDSTLSAVTSVARGSLVVFLGGDGCCGGSKLGVPSGPFSYVAAYEGQSVADWLKAGTWGKGQKLDGRLRLDRSDPANPHYKFVSGGSTSFTTGENDAATLSPQDGSIYRLRSIARNRMLLDDGSLRLADRSADASQQWRLERRYGSFFRLSNQGYGGCATATGGIADCGDSVDQLWRFDYDKVNGGYTVTAAAGGALTATDGGVTVGGSGDQLWSLDLAPGLYTIESVDALRVVGEPDANGPSGTQLELDAFTGAPRQQWRLVDQGSNVTFVNAASGLCMDNRNSGTVVERWTCTAGAPNQQWTATSDASGLLLKSADSPAGKALALGHDGDDMVQAPEGDSDTVAQRRWVLHRMPEPVVNGTYVLTAPTPVTRQSLTDRPNRTLNAGGNEVVPLPMVDGGPGQQWQIVNLTDGAVGLRNPLSGKCVSHGGVGSTAVTMDTCSVLNDGYQTGFRMRRQDDGTYVFSVVVVSGEADRVLAIEPNGTVVTEPPSGAASQRFTLTGHATTFRVGDTRSVATIPSSSGGFAVLALDTELKPLDGMPRTFVTNGPSADPKAASSMASLLSGAKAGATVLVQSIGRPQPTSSDWNALGDGIAAIGGDKDTFLQLEGYGDYALAGCGGCASAPAFNEQTRSNARWRPAFRGARVEGELTRDGNSAYRAQAGSFVRSDLTFDALAERDPVQWSYTDTDAGRQALQWFQTNLDLGAATCPADIGPVRSSYCVGGGNAIDWATKRSRLSGLSYASTAQFDEATFDAVQARLESEFDQLAAVRALFDGVADGFSWALPNTQNNVQSLASVIQADMGNPTLANNHVAGRLFEVFKQAFVLALDVGDLVAAPDALGGDDPVGPGQVGVVFDDMLGIISDVIESASANDSGSEGASDEGISTVASDYAHELEDRLNTAIANLPAVQDLVVSDPVKLALAADSATRGWAPAADEGTVTARVQAGTRRAVWTKLLPAAATLWKWPIPPAAYDYTNLECRDGGIVSNYWHWMYRWQGASADWRTVLSNYGKGVDGDGKLIPDANLMITPAGTVFETLKNNVDRTVKPSLFDSLYGDPATGGGGFVADELRSEVPFTTIDRFNQDAKDQCGWTNGNDGYNAPLY